MRRAVVSRAHLLEAYVVAEEAGRVEKQVECCINPRVRGGGGPLVGVESVVRSVVDSSCRRVLDAPRRAARIRVDGSSLD